MPNLTALKAKNAKPGDRLSDGNGLRLDVDKNGNASWIFRFRSPTIKQTDKPTTGKERFMGLGPFGAVTLAQARDAASAARTLIRGGVDPIEQRIAKRAEANVGASRAITFAKFAEQYVSAKESGWTNIKHRRQWLQSLRDHVFPTIGHLPVADIDTDWVEKVLLPIWGTKQETARRVRGRIESILNAAKVKGLRVGPNPALWRGHLSELLAKPNKSKQHFAALPYSEMPRFWKSLSGDTSDAARMLKFIILTACRFSDAANIDLANEVKGDLWAIPAARMKARRAHSVPLTAAVMACLPFRRLTGLTTRRCIARHTDSPATTHGFRSTFRDWAGDCTNFSRETVEAALAHSVGNATELAYRRSDALAKRRELMEAWTTYCCSMT